ncbi:MAG: hypothetical protein J6A79_07085 [Clostridia bacterium]|nr:hypothetical protein [Clostridia bacterium]
MLKGQSRVYVRFNDYGNTFVKDYPVDLFDNTGTPSYSSHPDEQTDIVALQIIPRILEESKAEWNAFDLDTHFDISANV